MIASTRGPRCPAPEAVALEIARHIPRLAAKRRLDSALMFAALGVMPFEWKVSAEYEDLREEAEERIAARDPDDWPTVALALTLCGRTRCATESATRTRGRTSGWRPPKGRKDIDALTEQEIAELAELAAGLSGDYGTEARAAASSIAKRARIPAGDVL